MCLTEAPASSLGLEKPCAEGAVNIGGSCNSTIAQCGTKKDLFYERTECHNDRACSTCDNYGVAWGGVCLMKLTASELPANCTFPSTLGKCNLAAVDAICEADGELGTNTMLNQCGDDDFYRRVISGEGDEGGEGGEYGEGASTPPAHALASLKGGVPQGWGVATPSPCVRSLAYGGVSLD